MSRHSRALHRARRKAELRRDIRALPATLRDMVNAAVYSVQAFQRMARALQGCGAVMASYRHGTFLGYDVIDEGQ